MVVKNDTWGSPVRDIDLNRPVDIKDMTCILIPYFNNRDKKFDNTYLKGITLDGTALKVKVDCIEIKKTRITDSNLKEELNRLIEFLKEDYKFQKEQVKFYEDLEKKKKVFSDKTSNHEATINTLINQVKKSQGFLSYDDVLSSLNNILNLRYDNSWLSNTCNPNIYYKTSTDDNVTDTIKVAFLGSNILSITVSKEALIDVYRDFDLDKEFDFSKKRYFKTIDDSKLNNIGATQSFSSDFVEEDFITINHDIKLDFNIKTTIANMKDIEQRFNSLLKLLNNFN